MEKKTLTLPWQGMNIKVTYQPHFSEAVREIQGYQLAHITVTAATPLPITETGFRSIFLADEEVKQAGGAIAYVRQILDEAAKSKEWQQYKVKQSQLSLF